MGNLFVLFVPSQFYTFACLCLLRFKCLPNSQVLCKSFSLSVWEDTTDFQNRSRLVHLTKRIRTRTFSCKDCRSWRAVVSCNVDSVNRHISTWYRRALQKRQIWSNNIKYEYYTDIEKNSSQIINGFKSKVQATHSHNHPLSEPMAHYGWPLLTYSPTCRSWRFVSMLLSLACADSHIHLRLELGYLLQKGRDCIWWRFVNSTTFEAFHPYIAKWY